MRLKFLEPVDFFQDRTFLVKALRVMRARAVLEGRQEPFPKQHHVRDKRQRHAPKGIDKSECLEGDGAKDIKT